MNDCLFCKIIVGEMPSHKIYEDEKTFVFLDINPVNLAHSLVVPKVHSETIFESKKEDAEKLIETAKYIGLKIQKIVDAQGMNININSGKAAGQIIFHTHIHLIPRFEDDGFKHWQGKNSPNKEELEKLAKEIRTKIDSL